MHFMFMIYHKCTLRGILYPSFVIHHQFSFPSGESRERGSHNDNKIIIIIIIIIKFIIDGVDLFSILIWLCERTTLVCVPLSPQSSHATDWNLFSALIDVFWWSLLCISHHPVRCIVIWARVQQLSVSYKPHSCMFKNSYYVLIFILCEKNLVKKRLKRLTHVSIVSLGRESNHFLTMSLRVKKNKSSLM
jgi:hypothetical protein